MAWTIRKVACSVPPTLGNGRMCAMVNVDWVAKMPVAEAALATEADK
jgi:hypothetical protein